MTSNNSEKNLHKTDWLGNIGCFALLLVMLAWAGVIYNGVHTSLNRGTIALEAEVTVNQSVLTLQNKDGFDWRYVYFSLDVDDNPETYEYSFYLTKVPGKESVTLDLTQFKKDNLVNFDPATLVPKHLSFFAQTSQGTGHYIYTWPGY
jgi:hypothetical protein